MPREARRASRLRRAIADRQPTNFKLLNLELADRGSADRETPNAESPNREASDRRGPDGKRADGDRTSRLRPTGGRRPSAGQKASDSMARAHPANRIAVTRVHPPPVYATPTARLEPARWT
jgi:hypothetical protein